MNSYPIRDIVAVISFGFRAFIGASVAVLLAHGVLIGSNTQSATQEQDANAQSTQEGSDLPVDLSTGTVLLVAGVGALVGASHKTALAVLEESSIGQSISNGTGRILATAKDSWSPNGADASRYSSSRKSEHLSEERIEDLLRQHRMEAPSRSVFADPGRTTQRTSVAPEQPTEILYPGRY